MTLTREELEDHAARYEKELGGLRSYMKELREAAAKHGTDESMLQDDLLQAEHNVSFYEAELGRVRRELGGAPAGSGPAGVGGSLLSLAGKQGVGALALVSIGFAAGVLVGSLLNPRKGE